MKKVEENKKDRGGEQLPRRAALKTTPSCDLSESTPDPLQLRVLLLFLLSTPNSPNSPKLVMLPSGRRRPASLNLEVTLLSTPFLRVTGSRTKWTNGK